jgi:hypothetical protein
MTRRKLTREIYSAVLELGDVVDLKLRSGAHVRTIDSEGNVISDERKPSARLWTNIGDRLLLAPADLVDDRIAVVEVSAMQPDGNPIVHLVCGELAPGPVHVMRGPRPADTRPVVRRAVVRRPAKRPGQAIAELARRIRLEAGGVR